MLVKLAYFAATLSWFISNEAPFCNYFNSACDQTLHCDERLFTSGGHVSDHALWPGEWHGAYKLHMGTGEPGKPAHHCGRDL